LRLERRLSQERLAELSGLGYKYIGQVELAKMEPGADALVRLARGLAVPVGELFETITPARQQPYRLSLPDLDTVTLALTSLTTVLERVRAGQAAPLPSRAPRGSRR
jgi:transcriptional regulator with XRE-family HTH domain